MSAGHQMAGLLVGSVSDLFVEFRQPEFSCSLPLLRNSCSRNAIPPRIHQKRLRTLGIAACPLKRRRTRLSIPLGFLHDGSTPVESQSWPKFPVPARAGSRTLEAIGLMPVEALGVLLHDGNVLLCGNHLVCRISIVVVGVESARSGVMRSQRKSEQWAKRR